MKSSFNSCSIPFNPFTKYIDKKPGRYRSFRSYNNHIPFTRKLLNVIVMPLYVTQSESIYTQILEKGVDHLDLAISYHQDRWVITNGLYITRLFMEGFV